MKTRSPAWYDPIAVAARQPGPVAGAAMHATNGIDMFAIDVGRGRPIVLLHGLGWDHSLWGRTVSRYRDRYRMIAADTRGHGRSSKPAGPYTIEMLRDDWLGLVDSLRLGAACLIGLSQGGMITQAIALERPNQCVALVLIGTACRTAIEARPHMEERIAVAKRDGAEPAARLAAKAVFSARFRGAEPAVVEEFVAWRAGMAQEPLFAAIRAGYTFNVCDRLSTLTVPCFVLAGRDDALISTKTTGEIASRISGAEFEVLADCGHMIPIERPQEFEHVLDRFLSRHYPP